MKPSVRPCIAYAAWRSISGKEASGIFDLSKSKQISVNGTVTPHAIDIQEKGQVCHLVGKGNGAEYSLFDGGDHITLRTRNGRFSGHDYRTSSNFSGTVSGQSLNLYDCESGLSFAFRVEG
jgi:hypothetical protein